MVEAILLPFKELGAITLFNWKLIREFRTSDGMLPRILEQILEVTMRSIPTVFFAGIFVGAILVLQFNVMLKEYDAQVLLGGLTTSSLVREVGPLIISFLLAGKIGAYTAAELGSMRVTEQIDAIDLLGGNAISYLIVPRFIGIVLASALLLVFSLVVSVVGAMTVASLICGVNFLEFSSSIPKFSTTWTLFCGALKSLVYSSIVASVSCYKGFNATGGAKGVGRAVTATAVQINLYIVVINYVLSQILEVLSP